MSTQERTREIPFIGTKAEYRTLLAWAKAADLLVSYTPTRDTADGTQVTATVCMRDHAPVTVRVQPQPQPPAPVKRSQVLAVRRWAIVTVSCVVGLVVLGYLAFLATAGLVAAALPYVGAGLLAVVALWLLLGRTGRCVGIHCPGCGH